MSELTVFDRILSGEIPARKVYEDDNALAFHDVNPQAPVHVIVIPKRKLIGIGAAGKEDAQLLGFLLLVAQKVANDLGLASDGYRLVINEGRNAGQTVSYLHCHLLGGRTLNWPPG